MERLAAFLRRYAVLVMAVVIIATAFLGYHALQIEMDAGMKGMLPEDDPVVEEYDRISELFGGMASVLIMIEDDLVIDGPTLSKISDLTSELREIEGVHDVTSLTNLEYVVGIPGGIEIERFVPEIPGDREEIEAIRERLLSRDQYINSIVDEDFTSTAIMVGIEHEYEEEPGALVREIRTVADRYAGPERIYYTGRPVMINEAAGLMRSDLARLLPFVLAVVLVILALCFGSARGVLLPVVTVLMSVIWALGVLRLGGRDLSIVSTVLPVLLVSVGSAYAIHVLERYYEEVEGGLGREVAVERTLRHVGPAVIMAGVTTMVGFGALFLSELPIIQDFAMGTAAGIGSALLISVIFVPSALFILPPVERLHRGGGGKPFFRALKRLVFVHRRAVIGVVGLVIVVSAAAIPRIGTETNYLSYFREESMVRRATEVVDERLGGSEMLEVVIHGDIREGDLLERMSDFQDAAEGQPLLSKALSMVTILREQNRAIHEDRPEMEVIPETREQIAQYLLLLEMSDPAFVEEYLSFDYGTSRIRLRMQNASSREQLEVIAGVRELAREHFGDGYRVEISGAPVLAARMSEMVVSSQVRSLLGSVVFAFLVTGILFRSLRRGLYCTVPLALAVLLNFGIMGLFGISLDMATAMIASVAVGIGIDYSIHIYSRYLEEFSGGNSGEALGRSIETVGRANLYNASAVTAGFLVIVFSAFPPLIRFGALTAVTMVISFAGAMIVLPVVIRSGDMLGAGEKAVDVPGRLLRGGSP